MADTLFACHLTKQTAHANDKKFPTRTLRALGRTCTVYRYQIASSGHTPHCQDVTQLYSVFIKIQKYFQNNINISSFFPLPLTVTTVMLAIKFPQNKHNFPLLNLSIYMRNLSTYLAPSHLACSPRVQTAQQHAPTQFASRAQQIHRVPAPEGLPFRGL